MLPSQRRQSPPYLFHGARDRFIREHLDEYLTAATNVKLHRFWPVFVGKYWAAFPSRLPMDVDPHVGMLLDDPTEQLSPDELAERRRVVLLTTKRIRSWSEHLHLALDASFVQKISLANRYRFYIARRTFTCAASVWAAYHLELFNLITRSWYSGDTGPLEAHQQRLTALLTLACALEAQGDTSRFRDASN
ncbi:hypothetical protein C8R46DRAFT_1226817 [Mycena filopes]|nr:hypothetical protein C8R46DRAFT_1226817 [Mycena filopes]